MIRVLSAALVGVTGVPVEVEVRLSSQLPAVDVVGLPEAAVRESVSRIRGAIAAAGFAFPDRRVTINLAPAELRKSGAGLDLPIAIGVLAASGIVPPERLEGRGLLGELALDGRLRATRGSLAAVLAMVEARAGEAIVARGCAARAAHARAIDVRAADDLRAVIAHLRGDVPLDVAHERASGATPGAHETSPCLSDIRGQQHAKRALEVAAAGGHGLLLAGPPGTGKTLLARRLPGLLPALRDRERLETFCVLDAAGSLAPDEPIPDAPPFRAPHHSASAAGLLGGGSPIRPGEVSLAHNGVLFLDELPEFDRRCLESLREVLEQGVVRIARASQRCELPARFQLVAAANPCPCGYYGTPDRDCRCDDASLARYRRRLSGPLVDRIDLAVPVGEVPWSQLSAPPAGPTSREVRARVAEARARQHARGVASNAAIPDACLDALVDAEPDALDLLGRAVERLSLSARSARRVMRVARTLADLGDCVRTPRAAMAEALQMRAGW
ncbi:MAG: YifB family Mg chelatase-like AAA ATPase [Spirochaetaceae bacterium]|nr:YifB family Mg chelatase-like AAA ATPase [Myxococcales bacterium]MCA9606335.1 YifB family Mg chelatase-like AAA ATPase [Myxococcales bacterium]MCB9726346.1 YifB family Mg chelatase-like AAA ATPase [Spirochaetaceae bacterium]